MKQPKNDYVYSLKLLVTNIEKYFKLQNIYPQTEQTFKKLQEADNNLTSSISLAKELIKEHEKP